MSQTPNIFLLSSQKAYLFPTVISLLVQMDRQTICGGNKGVQEVAGTATDKLTFFLFRLL